MTTMIREQTNLVLKFLWLVLDLIRCLLKADLVGERSRTINAEPVTMCGRLQLTVERDASEVLINEGRGAIRAWLFFKQLYSNESAGMSGVNSWRSFEERGVRREFSGTDE